MVWIVRAAGRHDGVVAHLGDFFRRDLGIRVRHGEDDRLRGHARHHFLGERTSSRKAKKYVRAIDGFGKRARLGIDSMSRFPLVHALLAPAIDDARGIAEDRVFMGHPHGFHQLKARDASRARAIAHELDVLYIAPRQMQRVDEPRNGDDGGAMLVIMENRNIHQLAQTAFNQKAVRSLDVFKIDAAP